MTHPYTHAELNALQCARRSGIEPGPDAVDRLLATIEALQRELVQESSRHADEVHRLEYVTADVEVLGRRGR